MYEVDHYAFTTFTLVVVTAGTRSFLKELSLHQNSTISKNLVGASSSELVGEVVAHHARFSSKVGQVPGSNISMRTTFDVYVHLQLYSTVLMSRQLYASNM
eukprot:Gb_19091 [translate_table: standard]